MRSFVLGVALAATALTAAQTAAASTAAGPQYRISYDATSAYPVTDIAIFQSDAAGGSSLTNSFKASAGETVIDNPFPVSIIPNADFLLGVATGLATDEGASQQHLVLFTNDTFAANAQNEIAFGTLFPNTNEAALINDLEVIGQTVPGNTTTAYGDLFNFAGGDAVHGPNGSITFATGDTFTEIAFSGGQIIGTGLSSATLIAGVSAAPEPSTWALMIAGLGLIGAVLRGGRRGRSAPLAA